MMVKALIITVVIVKLFGHFTECHAAKVTVNVRVNVKKNAKGVEDCILDVGKDLPDPTKPQPLYLKPNSNEYWLPNQRGQLVIPKDSLIELYCGTTFNIKREFFSGFRLPCNLTTIFLRCTGDKLFSRDGDGYDMTQKYVLRDLVCKRWMYYTIESLNVPCSMPENEANHSNATNDGNDSNNSYLHQHATQSKHSASTAPRYDGMMYRVGYTISEERFIETMRMCHDDKHLRALYVQFRMDAANIYYQRGVNRLTFSQGGYFRGLKLNYLYSFDHQMETALDLLDSVHASKGDYDGRACEQQLENSFDRKSNLYLARGHLAAKSDFIYANQQRSTFQFFNVAPQWQTFNAGQWNQLENEIRKFIARRLRLQVDCYAGTLGTLKLPFNGNNDQNCFDHDVEFYLATDDNNNGILPVPWLFFRVLVDRLRPDCGIAIVGVNNPHRQPSMHIESNVSRICKDIHRDVNWLHWIRNDEPRLGHLFACRVSDFVKKAPFLPPHLHNVTRILR